MKKGDDFFRITFNRQSEEVRKFEQGIEALSERYGMSRPAVIVMICNSFMEQKHRLSVSPIADVASIPAIAAQPETEPEESISNSDSVEMLRAMGLM